MNSQHAAPPIMTPRQVFDAKWPSLQCACRFRADRGGLRREDAEDVAQFAAASLWQECQRGLPLDRINCTLLATAGWQDFRVQRYGRTGNAIQPTVSLDVPNDEGKTMVGNIPARQHGLKLGRGMRYTASDAWLDAPERFGMLDGQSITIAELSTRLGMTPQRVHQLRHKLGGVKIGSRWRFPATALGWKKKGKQSLNVAPA